jgi:hypothetical protein
MPFIFLVAGTLMVAAGPLPCFSQLRSPDILCHGGDGNFDFEFSNGAKVHIGASHSGDAGFASHACEARLVWGSEALSIATDASELDLDALGVDFGGRTPSVAFQVRKFEADRSMEYRLYSLEKPPRLLRTITGGEFYGASDVDLDGRIEIWSNDSATFDGFEEFALSEFDFPPVIVLRFEGGRLLDVSAEFQSFYDSEISKLRSFLDEQSLADFKNSSGSLQYAANPVTPKRLHQLRLTKARVLEIVWSYLYSGREEDAWRSLNEMWPVADFGRIRAALENARSQGIRRQIDGTSTGATKKKKKAQIFNAIDKSMAGHKLEVTPPSPILIQFPQELSTQSNLPPDLTLDLTIDSAGKVRSAAFTGKGNPGNSELLKPVMNWKFIPAMKDGHPVASLFRIDVSPRL